MLEPVGIHKELLLGDSHLDFHELDLLESGIQGKSSSTRGSLKERSIKERLMGQGPSSLDSK